MECMLDHKSVPPPQQKRSKQTLERLLAATISVLDEFGLEGAVIPRIAAKADVAPASVYRRFANKDDLIRAAFLKVLEASNEQNEQHLAQSILCDTLDGTATRLVKLLFQQYREHPKLMRSLSRFLDSDTDENFVREAQKKIAANVEEIVRVMLSHRSQINHADREAALRFAVLQAATAIEAVALASSPLWQLALPETDEDLSARFAQSMVAYLQQAG
jgi:AcrR family transcriptional regulator